MGDPDLTVERVLSEELRKWILGELRYAVLAINTGDGAPSQSVMWFDLDPDEPDVLLMNTKVERLKYRQLQRDPRVSVLFENGLDWTALRGTVTLDASHAPALEHIQALARVSRLMTMEDFRERIYAATSAEEIWSLLKEQEAAR